MANLSASGRGSETRQTALSAPLMLAMSKIAATARKASPGPVIRLAFSTKVARCSLASAPAAGTRVRSTKASTSPRQASRAGMPASTANPMAKSGTMARSET